MWFLYMDLILVQGQMCQGSDFEMISVPASETL
jgi:hypothetical protein